MIAVEVGAGSDVGRVRSLNEDAYHLGERIFLVADGMGGHAAGDVASRLTVDTLAELAPQPSTLEELRGAITVANTAVLEHAASHPESTGLGTTLAGLLRIGGAAEHWAAFNVGDSRVYQFLDGELRQLTVDHSEVEELIALGQLTREEAATHPSRHIITRAIGESPMPEVDAVVFPAGRGARFLICTDGLSGEVGDEEIAAILAAGLTAQETVDLLIRRALELGGRDNVTAIVLDEPSLGPVSEADGTTNPRASMRGAS